MTESISVFIPISMPRTFPAFTTSREYEATSPDDQECPCGATVQWSSLKSIGTADYDGELLDHRNCPCGSTLSRVVEPSPTRRNHLAIAQLSSQLNIALGLKRALDPRGVAAVVRRSLVDRNMATHDFDLAYARCTRCDCRVWHGAEAVCA